MTAQASPKGAGQVAIEQEMARQVQDAVRTFSAVRDAAGDIATTIQSARGLLLLGMGASHAAARTVEPIYRDLGIDAIAIPLSEQLTAPLSLTDRTVIVTSQSGESAEVVRWLEQAGKRDGVYGMTLDPHSTLALAVPCLVGEGGVEVAFAATRSLTITLVLHLAILAGLGEDPGPALEVLQSAARQDTGEAVEAFAAVRAVVTSGRRLQGLAEAMSLGVTELARIPAFALEGGQFRHGPPEMLGPDVGVVLLRGNEPGADLIAHAALLALEAGSPVVVFDTSDKDPVPGVVNLRWPRAAGLAAPFAILPTAQRFVLAVAAGRVVDVGTPRRSSKVTTRE